MSLRISKSASAALLGAVALAACGDTSSEPEGPAVECAIGPGAELTPTCAFESVSDGVFIIHRPDGGFRRFIAESTGEGLSVSAADGADPIASQSTDLEAGLIEFGLTNEAYSVEISLLTPLTVQAGSDE
ncbi:MAG: hypothetical protein AAF697_01600 [Pseudomonadota bacterium]